MDISFMITIFLIGFVGSFISGMLGIGGAIINFPMLLYIPVVLGVGHFTAHEVAGITAIQVFFATIGGVLAYIKGGFLNKTLIAYMGISILIGIPCDICVDLRNRTLLSVQSYDIVRL